MAHYHANAARILRHLQSYDREHHVPYRTSCQHPKTQSHWNGQWKIRNWVSLETKRVTEGLSLLTAGSGESGEDVGSEYKTSSGMASNNHSKTLNSEEIATDELLVSVFQHLLCALTVLCWIKEELLYLTAMLLQNFHNPSQLCRIIITLQFNFPGTTLYYCYLLWKITVTSDWDVNKVWCL